MSKVYIFIRLRLLVLALFLLSGNQLFSQHLPAPSNVSVLIKPLHYIAIPDSLKDSISNPLDLLSSQDSVRLSLSLRISPVRELDSIFVIVKDSSSSSNFLSFDRDSTLSSAGKYLFRNGHYFKLGMGKGTYKPSFHFTIFYSDIIGIRSDSLLFVYP